MDKKEIIAYLNAETEYSNVVLEQAIEYEQMGIDGLYIYNYDEDRKVQADFIATMKLIIKRVDIPVYIGVAVKKFEDIKKALYTGASYCVVNYSADLDKKALEQGIDRFGKDKICMVLNADIDSSNQTAFDKELVNELTELGIAKFFIKHVTIGAKSKEMLASIEKPVIIRDSLVRNDIVSLLSLDNVSAVATNYYRGKDVLALKHTLQSEGLEVKILKSAKEFSEFKTDANGLVPVVVQDYRTDEVLMLAYMNEEAFNTTIKTGRMTYWSRSRNELWIKGETSGHYQFVKKLMIDCDNDTILAKVHQLGAACHTGNYSCFYTELAKKEYSDLNPLSILTEDYNIIMDRKVNPRKGSYTNYLFNEGIDKILKKCGEEATEITIAAKNPDAEELKYEIADYLYHLMVLMVECDVDWNDIVKELANRRK